MIFVVFSSVRSFLVNCFTTILNIMLSLVLFYSFCSYMGWVRRLLWFLMESKLSEILNGADVTIGSIDINIVEGRLLATDAVIHTPHQKEWKWESPLIARVGRVYVEWDMWSIAYQLWWLWIDPPIGDIYTIHMSDVQVFVERQQHVFNLYLIDPSIVLPNPANVIKQSESLGPKSPEGGSVPLLSPTNKDQEEEISDEDTHAEEKAQKLVNQLFSAVKTIGNRDGWRKQKDSLTNKLKELQSVTKKKEYMQDGAKVITKVGKVVAKTTHLPTMPERRPRDKPPFYCRIGRIILRDVRVFTRQDMQWNKPIILKETFIRPAELCPPISSLDDKGNPAIYQPIERLVEVVWKRVLTEMAKSQTGKLFSAAMGEFLGIAITSIDNNSRSGSPQPLSPPSNILEYRPSDA